MHSHLSSLLQLATPVGQVPSRTCREWRSMTRPHPMENGQRLLKQQPLLPRARMAYVTVDAHRELECGSECICTSSRVDESSLKDIVFMKEIHCQPLTSSKYESRMIHILTFRQTLKQKTIPFARQSTFATRRHKQHQEVLRSQTRSVDSTQAMKILQV